MGKKEKLIRTKKELTLIESVVENSKERLDINNVINILKSSIFMIAKGKYKPIDSKQTNQKSLLFEFENRRHELEVHMADMLKTAYTHQYEIRFDEFHLSSAEMQAGYTSFTGHRGKEFKRIILFLSDCEPGFPLEPIKEGELREYDEDLEKNYLSHCKPVWTPSSLMDLYKERLKYTIK